MVKSERNLTIQSKAGLLATLWWNSVPFSKLKPILLSGGLCFQCIIKQRMSSHEGNPSKTSLRSPLIVWEVVERGNFLFRQIRRKKFRSSLFDVSLVTKLLRKHSWVDGWGALSAYNYKGLMGENHVVHDILPYSVRKRIIINFFFSFVG